MIIIDYKDTKIGVIYDKVHFNIVDKFYDRCFLSKEIHLECDKLYLDLSQMLLLDEIFHDYYNQKRPFNIIFPGSVEKRIILSNCWIIGTSWVFAANNMHILSNIEIVVEGSETNAASINDYLLFNREVYKDNIVSCPATITRSRNYAGFNIIR